MNKEYIPFFELLGKHSQLALRMLVPSKYEKLDTEIFACLCYQHMLLKKVVMDNMKECADKYANQKVKQVSTEKQIAEFENIELDADMERLIKNYLYFISQHKNQVSSDVITAYISYLLINVDGFKSVQFFKNCLYVKAAQVVNDELITSISSVVPPIPKEINDFGEFLTTPLFVKEYECFGREKEIKTCIEYLSRLKKNNIILVGEAGVGKTSIVYGVCNYVQSTKCPPQLKNFYIFNLNVNKIISGTKYRGDLEQRLESLINILKSNSHIILFIDEIHTLFTKASGDGEGSVIQNVLKPYLSTNSRVIGCTTNKEYKCIESDKAFERRFSKIHIDELSAEHTKQLLKSVSNKYVGFHNKCIDDNIIDYVVDSSKTYIKNKYLPDKALDVLDLSFVKCCNRDGETITKEDVDNSVYTISNIMPKGNSISKIENSEKLIKERIIGQDEAVTKVCKAVKRYCLGVNDKTKPIGCYLFVGPTGVGKTELCIQIANHFFTPESFIRFDMSEFMEQYSVSKFVGSAPGYVGYSEGGKLTEKVKHLPFSVILFDEIEKAHQDVINILLQIMDSGRLTDSSGNTVDFTNCLIVMTSNIGCRTAFEKNSIGFSNNNKNQDIISEVKDYFSPEFRNRLSDIIVFNSISESMYNKIFDNEFEAFIHRYKEVGINVELNKLAINKLKKLCYSEKDGVRFVQRQICNNLESIILDNLDNNSVYIAVKNDEFIGGCNREKSCQRELCEKCSS